jgi:hypothetical protein
MIRVPTHLVTLGSSRRHNSAPLRNSLKPLFQTACSGTKILHMSSVALFLWLLFPLFLMLTSDWIGLLVVFQAMTVAVRLRDESAEKAITASSSTSISVNKFKGEYRVL